MSRALPSGGPLETSGPKFAPLSLMSVDRPNINAKFARVAPPKSNVSTIFNAANGSESTPRFGKRVQQGTPTPTPEVSPRATLRITRYDVEQVAAARFKEDNPRAMRRHVSQEREPSSERSTVISGNGLAFTGGKKVDDRKFSITLADDPKPWKDYASMDRFKRSEKPVPNEKNVIVPETLPSHIPAFKSQRFGSSPGDRHNSLVGVLTPDPNVRAPPTYRPRAPFHTDA